MSARRNQKTELAVVIEGQQVRSLNVPTDSRADDFGLYRSLDEFVARNTEYQGMKQVVNTPSGVQDLDSQLDAEGGVTHRGMRVTSIGYLER